MPPVSSLTTSRSVPSIRSGRSGEASYRAGIGLTGRRFAYRPRPLRSPSSPCSGRGASGSVVSHFGPPTAASRTASAARQASRTSSVRAVPWASIEVPPNRRWSNSKSPKRASSSSVGAMISGPIPSPASVTMRYGTGGDATRREPTSWLPGESVVEGLHPLDALLFVVLVHLADGRPVRPLVGDRDGADTRVDLYELEAQAGEAGEPPGEVLAQPLGSFDAAAGDPEGVDQRGRWEHHLSPSPPHTGFAADP